MRCPARDHFLAFLERQYGARPVLVAGVLARGEHQADFTSYDGDK